MLLRETVLKLSVIASLILTVFCARPARGSVIAYDSFAYPVGSSLAGQNGGEGFSGAWYTGGYNVSQSVSVMASGSLTYPLLATAGNQVTSVETSLLNGVERNLSSPISSGTIYLSCMLSPEGTLDQGNGQGFFGLYLHGSANDLFMGKANISGTDYYDVEQRGGTGQVASAAQPVVGQTEFLVLKAQLASSGNDAFTLYTDPTPGAPEPSSGAVKNDLSIGTLSSLVIYSGGAFSIDDLRVGTTYADVTPTAASNSAWVGAAGGSWSNAGNWTGAAPNAIGAGAVINASTTAAVTIAVDAPQTLGTLLLGNSAAASAGYTLSGAGSNTLTWNNWGYGATITVTDGTHAINVPLVLNDNLAVSNNGSLTVVGAIADGSNGPMGITVSGSGLLVLAGNNTYSGSTTISGGTVTLAHPLAVQNSTVNVTNSGALSFAAGITSPNLGGLTGAGNVTLATAVAEPVMLSVGNNGQNTTYGGALSGPGGLAKVGSGALFLSGTSSFSGGTTIATGIVAVQNNSALGGGPVNLAGGTLQLNGPAGAGAAIGIKLGCGGANVTGIVSGPAGVIPISNWNNFSGESQSSPQPLVNNLGGGSGATATWNALNITWATYVFAGGNQADQNAQLLNTYLGNSGSGQSVTISGIPFSTYDIYAYFTSGNSNHTGSVTAGGATWYYQTLGPITTTPYPLLKTSDTTYDSTGKSYPLTNYALFSNLSGSAQTIALTPQSFGDSGLAAVEIVGLAVPNLSFSASNSVQLTANSTIDLSGANSGTLGNFVVASNSTLFVMGSGTASNTAYSLTLGSGSLAGNPTFDVANNGSGPATLVLGALNDGGAPRTITKTDAGALTLGTAATSLVPGTVVNINGGTLNSNNAAALGTFAQVNVAGGANFVLGASQQISSLGGSGNVTLGGNTLAVGNLDNRSSTFSGMLQGAGSLNKTGSGGLTLTATSTYAGPTMINQGALIVNGSLASPVTVNGGGTLAGTGYLSSVTVNPGGQVAPGDALGTLSLSGSLILESRAVMDYDLDTPSTSAAISCADLALSGQQFSDYNFALTTNFVPGNYDLIRFESSSGSLGANTSGTIDGYPATLAMQGNDLVLTVTPEPSALVLFATGAIGLATYVWRRRLARTAKPAA